MGYYYDNSPFLTTFFSKRSNSPARLMISLIVIAYLFGVLTSPLRGLFQTSANPSFQFRTQSLTLTKTVNCTHGDVARPQQDVHASLNFINISSFFTFHRECGQSLAARMVRSTLLEKLFNGISPFQGFPPDGIAPVLKEKRIKGWGSNGKVFERLMREVRPDVIVELGTFLGASAIHMASLGSDLGLSPLILCVDDYRGWPGFREKFKDVRMINGDVMLLYQFMQNVVSLNFTESILPLPFSTSSMLRKLCELGVYADLVEVDASHDFHSAWSDINAAYAILRPEGVLFGHDYFTKMDNRGVKRAVDLFAKVKGLRVEADGQHWILRSY